jgi:uncharacterized membrane protein YbhN (UPF0104 family)
MSRLGRRVPKQARAHAARLRIVLGIALSLLFLAVTISGIDLPLVSSFILSANPLGLAAAVAFVAADVGVRAFRWQTLLGGIASVRYRLALAFLCIGYFANALLPRAWATSPAPTWPATPSMRHGWRRWARS